MNKLKRITLYLLVVVIAGEFLSTPCFAFDDGDLQFWTTASASFDINKDWKGKFEEEFKFGNDAGHFYYNHSDLGFVYTSLADWMDLGFNYRQVFHKDSAGDWRRENRPHLNVTLKTEVNDFALSSRSRLEYRDREIKKDIWVYRHKATIKLPFELTKLKLQPYIADEVFIDLDKSEYVGNRLYSGFSLVSSKRIKSELYYLWVWGKSGHDRIYVNVIGAQLKFYF
ncbi:MAG: DUF2490 domain-containing protein [Planctomycetota bacterium]